MIIFQSLVFSLSFVILWSGHVLTFLWTLACFCDHVNTTEVLWSLEICWLNESRLIFFLFLVLKNAEVTAHSQVTPRLFTVKTDPQWCHIDPQDPEKSILRSGAGMSFIQISTSPCSKYAGLGKGILSSCFTSPGERSVSR